MWDGRVYSDIVQSRLGLVIALVLGALALLAARLLFSALYGAVCELIRLGPREYLRRAFEMDEEHVRLIGVLIWVVIAILLLAFPWGFTLA